jgi:transposase
MVRAYSSDLRSRVIKATTNGMSARQAAERFGVGISTAIVWVRRYRQSGEAVARRQGKPRGSRLDPHADFILGLVEGGTKDISLAEIAERLADERDVTIGITAIWTFLDRHGLTFKKRPRMRRSSSAQTSSKPGSPGSTASSTSTPRS